MLHLASFWCNGARHGTWESNGSSFYCKNLALSDEGSVNIDSSDLYLRLSEKIDSKSAYKHICRGLVEVIIQKVEQWNNMNGIHIKTTLLVWSNLSSKRLLKLSWFIKWALWWNSCQFWPWWPHSSYQRLAASYLPTPLTAAPLSPK